MWMKVKKLDDRAFIPHRAFGTDAGLDVFAMENGVIHAGKDGIIRTGIALAIPEGWVAVVKEKSGRAVNNKLTVGACVIDSSYRGEILIHMFNHDPNIPFTYKIGEKVVQLVMVPCWTGQPELVDELDETERGEGRFGSTGAFSLDGSGVGRGELGMLVGGKRNTPLVGIDSAYDGHQNHISWPKIIVKEFQLEPLTYDELKGIRAGHARKDECLREQREHSGKKLETRDDW